METKEHLNRLTQTIIRAAIAVHHGLGPGMLESAYEACLAYELMDRGFFVERQRALPLVYRGQTIDCGYRIDLPIERLVVVEVKSIERFDRVHAAQLLSYLRLSGCKVGLLFNFNVK
jgi:GxxExxY protein